ncbi:hypothetical protein [Aeromonas caviae]|uniref:hypothetical protein n=1 Tax=Aeromonas caviae TaxID=648 RepID=UPI003EC9204C
MSLSVMGSICNPHAQRVPFYQYRLIGEDYIAAQPPPLITLPFRQGVPYEALFISAADTVKTRRFWMVGRQAIGAFLVMIAVGGFMKTTLGYGA